MNTSEFDVIKKFFSFANSRDDVILAGGDDCAILSVPENKQLVVTTDTLISGVHFPENTSPENIAYKSIMVNLSDLAAMGATPSWLTLAISLPEIDESWLTAFNKLENIIPVDINRATFEELEALPGISTVLAERIIEERRSTGIIRNLDQLKGINGINDRMLARLKSHIIIGE